MCSKQNRVFKSKHVQQDYMIYALTKQMSCEYKCKFNGKKCNSNQWWNNDKCQRVW